MSENRNSTPVGVGGTGSIHGGMIITLPNSSVMICSGWKIGGLVIGELGVGSDGVVGVGDARREQDGECDAHVTGNAFGVTRVCKSSVLANRDTTAEDNRT